MRLGSDVREEARLLLELRHPGILGVVGWTLLSGGSPAAPRKPANFERSVAGCIEADFAANYLLQPIAITQQI